MDLEKTRKLINAGINETDPLASLICVLQSAVELVEIPGNDFCWSSWSDAEEAKKELVGLIRSLDSGMIPDRDSVEVIFAPTGPLQEVSLRSGWEEVFLSVARKYDQIVRLIWDSAGNPLQGTSPSGSP